MVPRDSPAGWRLMICETRTDVGRVRTVNEDSILIDNENGIYLLADGMGGHEAGEVASKLAVEIAYAYLLERLHCFGADGNEILQVMEEAFLATDKMVKENASGSPQCKGMGTTLLATVVYGNRVYVCSVGDSRLYLIRRSITQKTVDDTLGNSILISNKSSQNKIPEKYWNILTQAVGGEMPIVPANNTFRIFPDDILIMCSDGLYKMVSDIEIQLISNTNNSNLNIAADELLKTALKNGGNDNISFILIKHDYMK